MDVDVGVGGSVWAGGVARRNEDTDFGVDVNVVAKAAKEEEAEPEVATTAAGNSNSLTQTTKARTFRVCEQLRASE